MLKKLFPLILLIALLTTVAAQSGRRVTRPATQPVPPIQAPIWSQPDPEPRPARAEAPGALRILPASLLERELKSLDKGSFRLADFEGKIIVLNLWASWCGPCRAEVPEYEKVRKDYAGQNVEFIALTTEDPRTASDKVKQFVRSFNFGFRLGWADRDTALTLMNGRNTIPQTLVIAADGTIIGHWRGYSRTQGGAHLRDTIELALSQTSASVSDEHYKKSNVGR